MGGKGVIAEQPELYTTYEKLFAKYKNESGREAWKNIVENIKNLANKQDILYTADCREVGDKNACYIIPLKQLKGAKKLLEILKDMEIVDPNKSKISLLSTSACRVELAGISNKQKLEYDKWFTNYYLLDNPERIKYVEKRNQIKFESLFIDLHEEDRRKSEK